MKPMLACSTMPSLDELTYPLWASTKLDGIRCLIVNGVAVSRALKPIPNKHIQSLLSKPEYEGLDGELMLRSGDFNSVQSAVMSVEGKPDFYYAVFDYHDMIACNYVNRHSVLWTKWVDHDLIKPLTQQIVSSSKQLQELYDASIAAGFEGLILRKPGSFYKFGRSTLREATMLKLKPSNDMEAKVVGFEELLHNENEATIDNLGHTVRSHENIGKFGGDTLGSLVCTLPDGITFKIGTGFDAATRHSIWAARDNYLHKLVTFKYQELSKYGVPRFPVFKGFRNDIDI